jgi:hypothetical protein
VAKKPDPLAYRNRVMRDVIRVITPTAIATNLSPGRLVGFAKAVADVAAAAAREPIGLHGDVATTPPPAPPRTTP